MASGWEKSDMDLGLWFGIMAKFMKVFLKKIFEMALEEKSLKMAAIIWVIGKLENSMELVYFIKVEKRDHLEYGQMVSNLNGNN